MPCAFEHPSSDTEGCQFEGTELVEFDGKQWCIFHLPMKSDSGEESTKAGFDDDEIEGFNQKIHAIIDRAVGDEESDEVSAAGSIDLSGVVFPGVVSFLSKKFEKLASFSGATFTGYANFSEATFTRYAGFSEATFTGNAGFSGATFTGYADFIGATFTGNASFTGATFTGNAYFKEATFTGNAGFSGATFTGNAGFIGATFTGNAGFSGATFTGYAYFSGATFTSGADFVRATFTGDAYFKISGSSPKKENAPDPSHWQVSFRGAQFGGTTNFENRQFNTSANFDDCLFKGAPKFHGCAIHQGTEFPGPEGFPDTESEGAAQAYRTLKLAMETNRSRQEEAMFYALEQKSLRNTGQMRWVESKLSLLYEATSDYGQSVVRPIIGLLILSLLFGGCYAFWAQEMQTNGDFGPTSHPAEISNFTIEQLISPFNVWRSEDMQPDSEWHLVLLLLTTLQTILSTLLIALGVLAVRWRFRRG